MLEKSTRENPRAISVTDDLRFERLEALKRLEAMTDEMEAEEKTMNTLRASLNGHLIYWADIKKEREELISSLLA